MTGLLILALVGVTAAAGAYLVPATVPVDAQQPAAPPWSSASSAGPTVPNSLPATGQALTQSAAPLPTAPPTTGRPGVAGARPADVLTGWAQQMASKVDIPQTALQAYGYAELVLAQTTPACRLSWTTLAAIGKVESNHGSFNGSTLYPDGRALPAVVGPPLNGSNGNVRIPDSDLGDMDGDRVWDHAVGPMQFIPSTWRAYAVDADNDQVRDINDIDDASLAAGNYLCAGGRDLATPTGWWQAIASYNQPDSYRQRIFEAANTYGAGSRS
jgi:membrane-bound lytic murein transglycosylase B